MARKELDLRIEDEGRDKGKVYHLTEMPTARGEDWATRVLILMLRFGFNVPDRFSGMAGIATIGYQGVTSAALGVPEIRELMEEMMSCVTIPVKDPRGHGNVIDYRGLQDEDIEEIQTRFKIRMEVFKLHVGFTPAELLRMWTSAGTKSQAESSDTPGTATQ
jgi:hypothetical protein